MIIIAIKAIKPKNIAKGNQTKQKHQNHEILSIPMSFKIHSKAVIKIVALLTVIFISILF